MATIELPVRGHSPSQVADRIAQQVADPSTPETSDSLRYHGARNSPTQFTLHNYRWVSSRYGRQRARSDFDVDVREDGSGSRVVIRMDETKGLLIGGVCGFLPMLLIGFFFAKDYAGATDARQERLLHAVPIVFAILLLVGLGVLALVHRSTVKYLRAEQEYLARWLAG